MARSRLSAADQVLAAMVKDYRRMRRSSPSSKKAPAVPDPELAALLQRQEALRVELREIRQQIAAAKQARHRTLPPEDAACLQRIREAIEAAARRVQGGLAAAPPEPPPPAAEAAEAGEPTAPPHRRRRRPQTPATGGTRADPDFYRPRP